VIFLLLFFQLVSELCGALVRRLRLFLEALLSVSCPAKGRGDAHEAGEAFGKLS
jgi:hypothetical protein